MWKELTKKYTNVCTFNEPAKESDISDVETRIGTLLPGCLKSCLCETGGIQGDYGLGLIWPIRKIISENIEFRNNKDFRELYMPFDTVLFFADAGNGDQFFYPIQSGRIRRDDIFVWNHEDDSRSWVAPSLEKYLEWWLTGNIKI